MGVSGSAAPSDRDLSLHYGHAHFGLEDFRIEFETVPLCKIDQMLERLSIVGNPSSIS